MSEKLCQKSRLANNPLPKKTPTFIPSLKTKPDRVKRMSLLIASRSAENALLYASIWTLDGILCTVMRHRQHAGAPNYVSSPLYIYHERLACSDGWPCVGRFVLLRVEARLSCGSEADPQGFARAVGDDSL